MYTTNKKGERNSEHNKKTNKTAKFWIECIIID